MNLYHLVETMVLDEDLAETGLDRLLLEGMAEALGRDEATEHHHEELCAAASDHGVQLSRCPKPEPWPDPVAMELEMRGPADCAEGLPADGAPPWDQGEPPL